VRPLPCPVTAELSDEVKAASWCGPAPLLRIELTICFHSLHCALEVNIQYTEKNTDDGDSKICFTI
jgi:hypothetical protein